MKMSKLIVAASTLLLASTAFAADGPPEFAGADSNGDGFVDKAEFDAAELEMDFSEFDADKDGKLNPQEYEEAVNSECA